MELPEPSSGPLYTTKPTGCFNFKALFGGGGTSRPKTPLVLRKTRVSESDKFEVLVTESHNKHPDRHQRQAKYGDNNNNIM